MLQSEPSFAAHGVSLALPKSSLLACRCKSLLSLDDATVYCSLGLMTVTGIQGPEIYSTAGRALVT